jgi:hypothetical protein
MKGSIDQRGRAATQRFFVSYARDDARVVHQLVKLVTLSGALAFIDTDHIAPGDDWQQTIRFAVTSADAVVVFWSARARVSVWVRREWRLGLELGKRVIPVLMDSTTLPTELAHLQAIDLRVRTSVRGVVNAPLYASLLGSWEAATLARLLHTAAEKLATELQPEAGTEA